MRCSPTTAPALLAEADALASADSRVRVGARRARVALPSDRRRAGRARGAPAAMDDASAIADYAARFTPEAVQLAYQICAQGRADLALAPDEATGFSMTLLRLLAFEPARRRRGRGRGGPGVRPPSNAADVARPAQRGPHRDRSPWSRRAARAGACARRRRCHARSRRDQCRPVDAPPHRTGSRQPLDPAPLPERRPRGRRSSRACG